MSVKEFCLICIAIVLLAVASAVEACTGTPSASISDPKPKFDATGVKVKFQGSGTPRNGGTSIVAWQWVFDPSTDVEVTGATTGIAKATFGSTGVYTAKLRVQDNVDSTWSVQATCKVYISNVVSVEWVVYPDDVDEGVNDHGANIGITLDPHPSLPPGTTAKRIFSGKKAYDDTGAERYMRMKVLAKVTISNTFTGMSGSGFPVRIQLYDVDDPSANDYGLPEAQCTAPLDCDDPTHSAFDSLEDNRGEGIYPFDFPNNGNYNTTTAYVPNGNNYVNETVAVSLQPGDNVRAVASTTYDSTVWADVTWERVDSDSGAGLPGQVKRSPMLTVWRKLHIERDYMAPVASTGGEKNFVEGTDAQYSYHAGGGYTKVFFDGNVRSAFDDDDVFEGGSYVPSGGAAYGVLRFFYLGDEYASDQAHVNGDLTGESTTFSMYDDDNQTLFGTAGSPTPYYCSLGADANAFREAYIKPEYLGTEYSDQVDFNLNLTWIELQLMMGFENEQDVYSSESFWACLVVSCYQPDYNVDWDPDGAPIGVEMDDGAVYGEVPENDDNACAMFIETINDAGKNEERWVAHEIGHTGGPGDCSTTGLAGCIMNPNLNTPTTFCNKCLNSFRKYATWDTTNE